MIRNILKSFIQIICLQKLVFKFGKSRKCIYLTFDDGPDPEFTSSVLAILKDNNAAASFFLIGNKVAQYPDAARKIANDGHTLAGHTYDHKMITEMSSDEIKADLSRTRDCIKSVTGADTNLFRPPRGKMNIVNILHAMFSGYRVIHWSVTYSDYRKDSLDRLVSEMQSKKLCDGDILLLHDNNQFTVDALDDFIKSIKSQGYELCAIPCS